MTNENIAPKIRMAACEIRVARAELEMRGVDATPAALLAWANDMVLPTCYPNLNETEFALAIAVSERL